MRLKFTARTALLAIGTLTLAFLHQGSPAAAHNIVTREIAAGIAGPYQYSVGVFPSLPGTGPLFVRIIVTKASDDSDAPGLTVTVQGQAEKGGARFGPLLAASDPGHLSTYELLGNLETGGKWTLDVQLQGALGSGQVRVPVAVAGPAPSGPNWFIIAGAAALGSVTVAVGLWSWRRGARGSRPT